MWKQNNRITITTSTKINIYGTCCSSDENVYHSCILFFKYFLKTKTVHTQTSNNNRASASRTKYNEGYFRRESFRFCSCCCCYQRILINTINYNDECLTIIKCILNSFNLKHFPSLLFSLFFSRSIKHQHNNLNSTHARNRFFCFGSIQESAWLIDQTVFKVIIKKLKSPYMLSDHRSQFDLNTYVHSFNLTRSIEKCCYWLFYRLTDLRF